MLLEDIVKDDLTFIRTFMRIPDKNQRLVLLEPKPCQERFVRNLTGRDLAIKPAQIGMTTISSALLLKRTMTIPHTTSVIVAHEEFLTQRLLQRVQVMHDYLPDELRMPMDHRSSFEKRFPDINSVLYIGTARSQVFGRGEPIHNLLLSEEAFYVPDAMDRVILPALQRVPPDGLVIRESTPHGETNSFYDEVQAALKGQSTFSLQTFFWWDEPSNQLPEDSPRVRLIDRGEMDYTPEETVLATEHGLSSAQMRWRRWKIAELGDMFWQEHPEDLDTCFLVSGEPFYDMNILLELSKLCYRAPYTGPEGSLVWFEPEENATYIIGIDPGQGKITESVATVWRPFFGDGEFHLRHEATLAGLIEPETMGSKCKALGYYYNTAMLVPEANAHGLALVREFKDYPSVYYRRDVVSGRGSSHMGWLTTPSTKPFMMQQMKSRLRRIETHDAEFVRQLRAFRELGNSKVMSQAADDYHDSGCLAVIALVNYTPKKTRGFVGASGWRW